MSDTAHDGRLRDRMIVCVGFADWNSELWTNQHHLMSRLAAGNRILFVESLGLRRPTLSGRDLGRMRRRLIAGLAGPREADGLHVLSPLVLPWHGSRLVRALNARVLQRLVRRAMRRLGLSGDILWAYVPQAEALIDVVRPRFVVYHCVDDIGAQAGVDAPSFREAEQRFAERADLVLASSPRLAERLSSSARRVIYTPNVADHELFATALQPGAVDAGMEALPRPRIVFTGAVVATKLDLGLLAGLAARRPDWSIALVGPVGPGDPRTDVSSLAALPNVHLLGPRRYTELPAVLRGADVGLIPYAVNDLTRSVFPMKVYEYLSAGLPVVSTPLPALDGVAGVARAARADELAEQIDAALSGDDEEARQARSKEAARHSWNGRLEELAQAVAEAEQTR
jgi:glycosyltransferase involved in cell wall biosynthesis